MRFVAQLLRLSAADSFAFSSIEIQSARQFWIRQIQADVFPQEQNALNSQKDLSSKSSLLSLNPFLDQLKIIRAGGRLTHAPVPL